MLDPSGERPVVARMHMDMFGSCDDLEVLDPVVEPVVVQMVYVFLRRKHAVKVLSHH